MHYSHELWYTISAELYKVNQKLGAELNPTEAGLVRKQIQSLRDRVEEITRYLQVDLDGLGRVNQFAETRRTGLDGLAAMIQRRIQLIQVSCIGEL
ncbi:unnamed protein product [Echinostoma caproni]|uniref:Tektin n=1 Tax=Echinostoma caproni TaxID=27848 RepID=A0A183B038_9TREM|nr:unnamed protein product [Echinostoma caproni]